MTTSIRRPATRRRPRDPAFAAEPTVEVADVSVWFGPKVALSELSCSFGPGVTGLLGPNGAGKTTLMRALSGCSPSTRDACGSRATTLAATAASTGTMALVPEDEAVPAGAHRPPARPLHRRPAPRRRPRAPDAALATVGLLDVADRRVGGFSKGMRQRTKIAAALVSGRQVLVLDEPLNGADPVQRVA